MSSSDDEAGPVVICTCISNVNAKKLVFASAPWLVKVGLSTTVVLTLSIYGDDGATVFLHIGMSGGAKL